jgi:hypothetical protein
MRVGAVSIYSTWLSIADERQVAAELADHGIDYGVIGDDGPVDDLADLPDEMLDAPIIYEGSHVLPSDTDRRGGCVEVAAIPNHITRDGRDDATEGSLKDWLRLSVQSVESEDPGAFSAADATVVLTRNQVERLNETLTGWLDRPAGES